jgi:RHS repeat-associated protein
MNNQRHYGLIDSLVITRNGNQLKAIEDYAQKHLTYTGASDFYDGYSYNTEYYYNANGALESDINRDIDLIQYDDLGNTRCIYYFGQNQIEYVYAADGTKLRTIHRPASSSALTDSIDYIGNLILKNGQPSMYLFDGGYASFDANGAVEGWHYYIQDYMGNNRMVVNSGGAVEQITHYYPYGGVIGDISTNESVQKYKFEGKELDRTFGLDNYDVHARQYFAMAPMWDRIDPLAERYYGISPYMYCLGDPINKTDLDGKKVKLQQNKYLTSNYYYVQNKYLKKYPNLASSLRKVILSETYTVTLRYTDRETRFDPRTNTIYWNPYYAVQTDNGYRLTPMQALFHDFGHAEKRNENPEEFYQDFKNADAEYDNLEDKRVITGEEQNDAKILAPVLNNPVPEEGTRTNHSGIGYESQGCDSTEPTVKGRKKLEHELDNIEIIYHKR